jgi:hypothetical protein
MPKPKRPRLALSPDAKLLGQLKTAAAKDRRSIAAMATLILQRYFQKGA